MKLVVETLKYDLWSINYNFQGLLKHLKLFCTKINIKTKEFYAI